MHPSHWLISTSRRHCKRPQDRPALARDRHAVKARGELVRGLFRVLDELVESVVPVVVLERVPGEVPYPSQRRVDVVTGQGVQGPLDHDLRRIGRHRQWTGGRSIRQEEVAIALDGGLVRGHVVAARVDKNARIVETRRQAPRLLRRVDVVRRAEDVQRVSAAAALELGLVGFRPGRAVQDELGAAEPVDGVDGRGEAQENRSLGMAPDHVGFRGAHDVERRVDAAVLGGLVRAHARRQRPPLVAASVQLMRCGGVRKIKFWQRVFDALEAQLHRRARAALAVQH